jgi:hypothetical protein
MFEPEEDISNYPFAGDDITWLRFEFQVMRRHMIFLADRDTILRDCTHVFQDGLGIAASGGMDYNEAWKCASASAVRRLMEFTEQR